MALPAKKLRSTLTSRKVAWLGPEPARAACFKIESSTSRLRAWSMATPQRTRRRERTNSREDIAIKESTAATVMAHRVGML